MTDRELVELAAKAAGVELTWHQEMAGTFPTYRRVGEHYDSYVQWNPLTDDGDALRLAVKLQLGISIPPVVDGRVDVVTFYGPIISIIEYPVGDDRYAATRLAIVRAAAEIGRTL
jgi:hypothetical protein